MRRLATIRALLVLLVLAGALVVGSALPAAAQEAPTGTVHIRQQATLVAGGAAIRVPIRYSCSPDTAYAEIDVQVTERVGGNRLAQGFGFTQDLTCDSQVHTAVVTVTAFGDNAFRRGGAFAQATVTLCNEFACTELRTSRDITIVRR
jgi:hypothetical protein